MDLIGLFLAISGILVSGAFGCWGVFLTLKNKRYPGQLTFCWGNRISLFDDIVSKLDNLSILFKKDPIGSNVVLFTGDIVNTGRKDVTPDMVAMPLVASFPAGYKFVEANIVEQSKGVTGSVSITSDTELEINLGFLRCKEFISLQVLIEIPQSDNNGKGRQSVRKVIEFKHRISDTAQMETVTVPKTSDRETRMLKRIAITTFCITIVFPFLIVFRVLPTVCDIDYVISDPNGQNITVRLDAKLNDLSQIEAIDPNIEFKYTGSIEEINKTFGLKLSVKRASSDRIMNITMCTVLPVLGVILMFTVYFGDIKIRRLRKLMPIPRISDS